MPKLKTYKVFISHSWSYHDDYLKLKKLLEEKGMFDVEFGEATKDTPINSENAAYIKQKLKQKTQSSNVVLGLAGIYASHSEWMQWEIETAYNSNIPIIGVIPRGQERISTVVSSKSKVDVRWNTDSIVDAIRKYAL